MGRPNDSHLRRLWAPAAALHVPSWTRAGRDIPPPASPTWGLSLWPSGYQDFTPRRHGERNVTYGPEATSCHNQKGCRGWTKRTSRPKGVLVSRWLCRHWPRCRTPGPWHWALVSPTPHYSNGGKSRGCRLCMVWSSLFFPSGI